MPVNPKMPMQINGNAWTSLLGSAGKKAGRGIEKLAKVIAKPMSDKEQEEQRAAREQEKAAAKASSAEAAHQEKLRRSKEFHEARTAHQVEQIRRVAEAKAEAINIVAKAKNEAAPKPAAKKPAAKAAAPKAAAKPKTPKAPKATKAPVAGKDGILKPVVSKSKAAAPQQRASVDVKAGEAYND